MYTRFHYEKLARRFLCNYVESISTIKYHPHADFIKGKTPIQSSNLTHTKKRRRDGDLVVKKQWVPPPSGCVKLNVDGSFHGETKDGGVWVQSYVMTGVQSFSLLAIFWVLAPRRWKWN
jgi:hypothetical protein